MSLVRFLFPDTYGFQRIIYVPRSEVRWLGLNWDDTDSDDFPTLKIGYSMAADADQIPLDCRRKLAGRSEVDALVIKVMMPMMADLDVRSVDVDIDWTWNKDGWERTGRKS